MADEIAEESKMLAVLSARLERGHHELDQARAERIPLPDDTPDDQIEWDETSLTADVNEEPEFAEPTVLRRWFDPREFRWAFGERLLSPATLRRYMRGQLPYPAGDPRNIFDPNPDGGRPLCIERLSERRQRILRDSLPLERYHPDVVCRLEWLMTQPWPAAIGSTAAETDVMDTRRSSERSSSSEDEFQALRESRGT